MRLASGRPFVRHVKMRAGFLVTLLLVAPVRVAAESAAAMSGDYVCAYGCRLTDAAPSVQINGDDAACMNEFGGLFRGRVLTANSISCFNKVGTLQSDGRTIRWDDGVIWRRMK
jgi:hypothetical protein